MVVHELPKLETRVRFPYPAPDSSFLGLFVLPKWPIFWYTVLMTSNLISGLLEQCMEYLLTLLVPVALAQGAPCPSGTIKLLEPIGGVRCLPVGTGPLGAFYTYFNFLFPWLVGVCAGLAILWGILGGAQMIFNAGEQGKYDEGKQKLMNAMIGLFLIIFSAMILNFLNPTFYLI